MARSESRTAYFKQVKVLGPIVSNPPASLYLETTNSSSDQPPSAPQILRARWSL